MAPRKPDKGGTAEEALREYFIESGYFVVRGVVVNVAQQEVTDVDLWVYTRASALHRIRANVDAKNRGTPKALERILWAKGLQMALGLEASIVATTDNRDLVKEYGAQNGVQILNGNFLNTLVTRTRSGVPSRLSEEEFVECLTSTGVDKLQGNWVARLEEAKSRLLTRLDFSGCNSWLEDLSYFLDAFGQNRRPEAACRCAYLMAAFFLVGLDFRLGQLAFEPHDRRRDALLNGFALGEGGRSKLEDMLDLLRRSIPAAARELTANLPPVNVGRPAILTDFFVRNDVARTLVNVAQVFEAFAFQRDLVPPASLPPPAKSVFAVLLDALDLDRRKFLIDPAGERPGVGK